MSVYKLDETFRQKIPENVNRAKSQAYKKFW